MWVAVISGLFLAMLDQTIVGTSLVTIIDDLGDPRWYVWTFVAYLVPATVLLPVAARMSDRRGRRDVLQAGMALFVIGSVVCGSASSMLTLVAGRAVQGTGAAALEALSFVLVNELARDRRRGAGQAAISAVMALSFIAGPIIGGAVTDHAGWRWTFWLNVPIGLVALAMVAVGLPRGLGRTESRATPIDVRGMTYLAVTAGAVLTGVSLLPESGWRDPLVLATGATAIVGGLLFVQAERHAAAPVVPLGLLTDPTTGRLLAAGAFASAGLFVAVVLVPRWYQVGQGASATEAGVRTYPLLVALLIGVNVGAAAVARRRDVRRPLLGAACLATLGAGLFLFLGDDSAPALPVAAMTVLGLGVGPALSGLQVALTGTVAPPGLAAAFGTLLLGRQVGGCLAMAAGDALYRAGGPDDSPAAATGFAIAVVTATGALLACAALVRLPRRSAVTDTRHPAQTVAKEIA